MPQRGNPVRHLSKKQYYIEYTYMSIHSTLLLPSYLFTFR